MSNRTGSSRSGSTRTVRSPLDTMSSMDTGLNIHQAPGSPVQCASTIRNKVKEMQKQLHNAQTGIEETNIEMKRVRQMLDPLRLSMKRYTDTLENNINKTLQNVVDAQGVENNRIDTDIESLQDENRQLKAIIEAMQARIESQGQSIVDLQGQVFHNYDSDEESAEKGSAKRTEEAE